MAIVFITPRKSRRGTLVGSWVIFGSLWSKNNMDFDSRGCEVKSVDAFFIARNPWGFPKVRDWQGPGNEKRELLRLVLLLARTDFRARKPKEIKRALLE